MENINYGQIWLMCLLVANQLRLYDDSFGRRLQLFCLYTLPSCMWQIAQLWPPKWIVKWSDLGGNKECTHVSRIRLLPYETYVPPERVRESHWERYRNSPQSSSRRTFPGNEDILFCLEQRWLVPFRLHDLRMLGTCQKTTGHQECWISTRREATPQEHCRYLEWLRIMRWWQPECVKMTGDWT